MTYRILISTPDPEWPLSRQAPCHQRSKFEIQNSSGCRGSFITRGSTSNHSTKDNVVHWGDCTFFIDLPVKDVDAWVVFENLTQPTRVNVPPENTLLITGEPPSIRRYRASYLQQFAHVVTCHRELPLSERSITPRVHHAPQGLPWHIGVNRLENDRIEHTFEQFAKSTTPTKSGLISVICSNKSMTDGHLQRQQFVTKIAEHFGGCLEVFGRGYREIGDKWDAIAPYHYHIVLENESYPDYFSEKLTDCFLANSYPFYYGCPNIGDYFPENSLSPIDIRDPQAAINIIEKAFVSDLYGQHQQDLEAAKTLVLDTYNIFPLIESFAKQHFAHRANSQRRTARALTLYPRRHRWGLQWAQLDRLGRSLVASRQE